MRFDELDQKLRVYETAHDHCVVPGMFLVARIDGRNFTRLTKHEHDFEAPFDSRFRDYMLATTQHLMTCGFSVLYGYCQSDEISLLFAPTENTFGRKLRKYHSVLAGEASAKFSLLLGDMAAFDCRLIPLPTLELVVDYFRWRNEDAARNALNAHCYWLLRKQGQSAQAATNQLSGLPTAKKHELLFAQGINFNDLPLWQKRGMGVWWEQYEKVGHNPISDQPVTTLRRRLKIELELPMKEAYEAFIRQLLV